MNKSDTLNTKKFKIEYLLIILIAVSVVAILFFNGSFSSKSNQNEINYTQKLQNDLTYILSQIKGVGKISCYISFDGEVEEIFLKNTTTINKNDGVEIIEEVILVNGKPYTVKKQYPPVNSLVVVCEGGDNISVKTTIINVLSTALRVPSEKIQIYKMK